MLRDMKRVEYTKVSDNEAIEAFKLLNRLEGILPALESAHAVAWVMKYMHGLSEKDIVIINLSGRGDKDINQVSEIFS